MHHKDIKRIIIKQLKKNYPHWQKLIKNKKKEIAKKVLAEVIKGYSFTNQVQAPLEELLGIEDQLLSKGIKTLSEMSEFVESYTYSNVLSISKYAGYYSHIKDKELRFIDNILDNQIINMLLSYSGYSPSKREFFPSHMLRSELLKAIKYPEISYRKYCTEEYLGLARKQNRAFIGLPLNKNITIDHTQLSQFRRSLSFSQVVNLIVYILHHFNQSGLLGDCVLYGIDSTELANDCKSPLASLEIRGQKIRIYEDLDCDCGKRRNKRDKSVYVVGYRMHTLTAIDAKSGHSYPLASLLAPANHHDSHFIELLVKLGQVMGIDLKLAVADEAYTSSDGALFKKTGVHLITPPSSKVLVPANVDKEKMDIYFDKRCEIPMEYIGCTEDGHEFRCGVCAGDCPRYSICEQSRLIPYDSGYFQRIIHGSEEVSKAIAIRKNSERPFNLLKKREGLENVRVRSQHALLARCSFTIMTTLLLEMANTRRKKKIVKEQLELFKKAA